ncbi:MAG: LAGLIDADG family homing endonuclease [archaeon]|nr:LAGLIDADG family homing endonuclease [archaeon]
MEYISPEEARIHAHICGDGCLTISKGRRFGKYLLKYKNPYKKRIRVYYTARYSNKDKDLLNKFSEDAKIAYSVKAIKSTEWELYLSAKWIYERLKNMGAGKSHEWFIHDSILNSDQMVISEWLKAFFDDEGHVDIESGYITLNSVNKNGLIQVSQMLEKIGITNYSIKGPYFYKQFSSYRLKILSKSLNDFYKKVGFYSNPKQESLKILLAKKAKYDLMKGRDFNNKTLL